MKSRVVLVLVCMVVSTGLFAQLDEIPNRLNFGLGAGPVSLTGDFDDTVGLSIPLQVGFFVVDFPVGNTRGMVNPFVLFEPGYAAAFAGNHGLDGVAWTMFSSWSIGADYWHRLPGILDLSVMGGFSLGVYGFSGNAATRVGPEEYVFTEIEDARSSGFSPRIGVRFRNWNYYLAFHAIGTPDIGLNPSYVTVGGSYMFLGRLLTGDR